MNIKTIYNRIAKDSHAVSPVVAVLVLIVVAVVGAAAVGVMTGAFVDRTEAQTVDPLAAGRTLVIAGSTTVEPVTREIARGFMAANPGVRVIVQGGGTGAGISAVGRDVIDIGMASRDLRPVELTDYPALVGRVVTIGDSTVLLVGNRINVTREMMNISRANLTAFFLTGARGADIHANISHGVIRSDRSGTGDEFAEEILNTNHDALHVGAARVAGIVIAADGNAGVLREIAARPGAIGGIDLGFTDAARHPDAARINLSIRSAAFPHLYQDRPLNLITHGAPSPLEEAFFNYARSPGAIRHFTAVGVRSVVA